MHYSTNPVYESVSITLETLDLGGRSERNTPEKQKQKQKLYKENAMINFKNLCKV